MDNLPVELQQQILSHLPLHSLLTYARTSKRNYDLSTNCLNTLHLAVFTKRIHGFLAFLNISDSSFLENPLPHRIAIGTYPTTNSTATTSLERASPSSRRQTKIPSNKTTSAQPPTTSPLKARQTSIHAQNNLLNHLLSTPTLSSLNTLKIHTTALLSPLLASLIATSLPHLHHLCLNFKHPYVHDPALPAKYWVTTPGMSEEGTPAWNALAGVGAENERKLVVRGLRTLEVRRAAVTGVQMREWIRRNKELKEVSLEMVTGVDAELCGDLGGMAEGGEVSLKVLEMEGCANLRLKSEREFEWVDKLVEKGLNRLSLRGCEGVDGEVLLRLSEERRWEERGLVDLKLPEEVDGETKSCEGDVGGGFAVMKVLEVDPAYM